MTKEIRRCEKCRKYARKGSKFCSLHGGKKGAGRPPSTFSRTMKKKSIFDLIDAAQKSENRHKLFDMTEDIASIQAILDSHREDVLAAQDNMPLAMKLRDEAGQDKKGVTARLKGFRAEMTDDEALAHLVAVTDAQAMEAIERLVEKKSAMIERFYKTERNKAETYTIQQIGVLVSYVATVIRGEITDPEQRKVIAARLELVPFEAILRGDAVGAANKVLEAEIVPNPPVELGSAVINEEQD